MFLLMDVAIPYSETTLLAAGGAMILIAAALAYVVFRLLRKTVRMALRMAVVAAIFVFILVGGIAFWWLSSGTTPKPRPTPARQR